MAYACIICIFSILCTSLFLIKGLPNTVFTTKEISLFFSIAIISIVFAVAMALFKGRARTNFNIGDIFVLWYLIAIPVIQYFFLEYISLSLVMVQVGYGIIFLLIRLASMQLSYEKVSKIFTETLVIVNLSFLTLGYLQYSGYLHEGFFGGYISGFFSNPALFAIIVSGLASMFINISVASLTLKKSKIYLLFMLWGCLGTYLVYLSFSRSAWIGLATGIVFPICYYYRSYIKVRLFKGKIWPYLLSSALILAFFVGLVYLYDLKPHSANGRILIWLSTLEMVKENLLGGVGVGNFGANYIHYQSSLLQQSAELCRKLGQYAGDTRYAFNDIFQAFSERGILGGTGLLCTIFYILSKLFREINSRNSQNAIPTLGSMSVIVTILTAGVTSFPLQSIPIALLFWITISVSNSLGNTAQRSPAFCKIGVIIFCLLVGGTYGFYGYVRTKAYLSFVKSQKKSADLIDLEPIWSLYPILNDRADYLTFLAEKSRKGGLLRSNQFLLHRAVKFSPSRELYYSLGKSYEEIGDTASARQYIQLVETAIPGLIKPRYITAMLYYNAGDTSKFLFHAKKTLTFKPKILNQESVDIKRELRKILNDIEDQNDTKSLRFMDRY